MGVSACLIWAFSGFYESHEPPPLGDALSIVLTHCDGHQNGQQSGYILHRRVVVVTLVLVSQWQHSEVSRQALYMLAIKMASDRGTFIHCRCLFSLT